MALVTVFVNRIAHHCVSNFVGSYWLVVSDVIRHRAFVTQVKLLLLEVKHDCISGINPGGVARVNIFIRGMLKACEPVYLGIYSLADNQDCSQERYFKHSPHTCNLLIFGGSYLVVCGIRKRLHMAATVQHQGTRKCSAKVEDHGRVKHEKQYQYY
jgi:hypothetical protein